MSTKKPGLTVAQHEDAGAVLRKMHADLTRLYVEVANAYPKSGKRSGRILRNLAGMTERLGVIRSELEELYAQENPDTWQTSTYYGGHDEEGA